MPIWSFKFRKIKEIVAACLHHKKLIEEINNIEEQCDICLKYKKPKLRPVVGFSLSRDFNHVLAVNLKAMKKVHILHIVDHGIRFSAAAVVKFKKKEETTEAFIKAFMVLPKPYCQTMVKNLIMNCFVNYINSSIKCKINSS